MCWNWSTKIVCNSQPKTKNHPQYLSCFCHQRLREVWSSKFQAMLLSLKIMWYLSIISSHIKTKHYDFLVFDDVNQYARNLFHSHFKDIKIVWNYKHFSNLFLGLFNKLHQLFISHNTLIDTQSYHSYPQAKLHQSLHNQIGTQFLIPVYFCYFCAFVKLSITAANKTTVLLWQNQSHIPLLKKFWILVVGWMWW